MSGIAKPRRPTRTSALAAALLTATLRGAGHADAAGGDHQVRPLADHKLVCVRDACFDAEVAVTAEERARGLMYRDSLAQDRGMLFVFPEEGLHGFWMKNTRIALDIVFIGADRRVVSIAKRAQPCRQDPCDHHNPARAVAYALEIGGGLADAYRLAPGDLVEFRDPPPGR